MAFFKTAFTGYAEVVKCIEATQRADLLAVSIHLFLDLLADETPEMDYAGSTLSLVKMLVDQILGARSQVPGMEGATSDKVIHGMLSACLSNVDEMR